MIGLSDIGGVVMKKAVVDLTGSKSLYDMHHRFAAALEFPDYYGHNLDALFDCLTDIRRPTTIRLAGFSRLGDWKQGFINVFEDCSLENPHVEILLD